MNDTAYPIRLVVTDDLRRSRLTVLFRLLLAVPHGIWLSVWSWVMLPVVAFNGFVTLVAGRTEEDVHGFLSRYVRYTTHVYAYIFLLANRFPGFTGRSGAYPFDLEIDPPERQNRTTVFFRLLLGIPAFVLATVLGYVLEILAFIAWFACLALGRMPDGLENLGAYCLRYQQQTYAYAMLLTGRYPSLSAPPAIPPRAPAP